MGNCQAEEQLLTKSLYSFCTLLNHILPSNNQPVQLKGLHILPGIYIHPISSTLEVLNSPLEKNVLFYRCKGLGGFKRGCCTCIDCKMEGDAVKKIVLGHLMGGPQCRMSILRNGNVACLWRLFSLMSHVEFKK